MKSKSILLIIFLSLVGWDSLYSQKIVKKINKKVNEKIIYQDMMYLASDELKGRKTGEPGNEMAASYIAEEFRKAGVKILPGLKEYYQTLPFIKYKSAPSGSIDFLDKSFTIKDQLLILDGSPVLEEVGNAVFANYALEEDYTGLDVKGKYVLAQSGLPKVATPLEVFESMPRKRKIAKEKGALGIIEIYTLPYAFNAIKNYFSQERIELSQSAAEPVSLFHAYLQIPANVNKPTWEKGQSYPIKIKSPGLINKPVNAVNVIGYIPGKKKELADQYILLTAHFDHVGVRAGAVVDNDTIWNGARDNAWGTVSVLAAARFFAKYPPDRSVLLAAVNGEEIGLVGSKYLADHPIVPWNKVIFDLNSDGAGYSDTTIVSILGLNRVGAADEMNMACKAFGLSTIADPAPEQGLFDRSDNVNFAKLGIPAPTFAAGFKTFDAVVSKYYHQSIDNPTTISYGYLNRFTKSFVYSAYLIANKSKLPRWVEGDKYEAAAKKLYGY